MIRRHLGFHALLASFQCQDGRRVKKAYCQPFDVITTRLMLPYVPHRHDGQ